MKWRKVSHVPGTKSTLHYAHNLKRKKKRNFVAYSALDKKILFFLDSPAHFRRGEGGPLKATKFRSLLCKKERRRLTCAWPWVIGVELSLDCARRNFVNRCSCPWARCRLCVFDKDFPTWSRHFDCLASSMVPARSSAFFCTWPFCE